MKKLPPMFPITEPILSEAEIAATMRRRKCSREDAIRILFAAAERSAPVAHHHPGKAFS